MMFNNFLLISVAIISVWLGSYIIFRKRSKTSISLSFINFSVALWAFTVFMACNSVYPPKVLFWGGNMAFLGPSIIPALFVYFALSLKRDPSKFQTFLIFTPTILLCILASLGFMSIEVIKISPPTFKRGFGYPIFSIYFFSYVGFAFIKLSQIYRKSKGITRTQVKYVFLSLLLGTLVGATCNLILPMIGIARFNALGPLSGFIFTGVITYAIVKHRLMDITIIIRKSLVYSISTSALLIAAIALVIWLPKVLPHMTRHQTIAVSVLAILFAVFALKPIIRSLRETAEMVLLKDQQRYREALRDFSRAATRLWALDALTNLIVRTVMRATQVKRAALWLWDERKGVYNLRAHEGLKKALEDPQVTPNSPIIARLKDEHEVIIREEQERILPPEEFREIGEDFRRLEAEVCVPIFDEGKLIGFLTLSNKPKGIYSDDDVEWLTTLANQSAVALRNAQLHQQVVLMKEYLESVLDNMQGGVVAVDSEQRVTMFNPAAERLTGLKADEVVGKPLWVLDRGIAEPLRETLEEGKVFTNREGTLNCHSPPLPILFSTSLLKDPSGRHGAVMVFADLSYVRRLEQERSRAERMVLVGTMAAELAHEIKNPLVSIRTFAELLPERHDDPEFRKYFQETTLKELDRINLLITQLSQTARPSPFKKVPVDLREPLEYTLMLIGERAKKSGVNVVRDYEPKLPKVLGEETRMHQLFLNLLHNALDAMPDGGTLTVSVRRDGGYVEVEIRDTGKGIPEEELEKVFSPFFSTKEGGMGLGLTICRRIVRDLEGELKLKPNPDGKGVAAHVRLPAADGR